MIPFLRNSLLKKTKVFLLIILSCSLFFSLLSFQKIEPQKVIKRKKVTAKEILENPKFKAICYGGYRTNTRDVEPTIDEIKEDLLILSALNITVLIFSEKRTIFESI